MTSAPDSKEMHACTPHRCMHRSKALLETRRSHTFAGTVRQMRARRGEMFERRVRPARSAPAGCCPRAADSREKTAPPASRAASAQPLRSMPAAMLPTRGSPIQMRRRNDTAKKEAAASALMARASQSSPSERSQPQRAAKAPRTAVKQQTGTAATAAAWSCKVRR